MWRLGAILILLVASACSGDDEPEAEDTTTTVVETESVTVRVIAEVVGLGCTATAPIGNGSQAVVAGADGTRLGVGTFAITPGAEVCDWTATVDDIPTGEAVYTIEGDGEELGAVDLADSDWEVTFLAGIGGVEVQP